MMSGRVIKIVPFIFLNILAIFLIYSVHTESNREHTEIITQVYEQINEKNVANQSEDNKVKPHNKYIINNMKNLLIY